MNLERIKANDSMRLNLLKLVTMTIVTISYGDLFGQGDSGDGVTDKISGRVNFTK